MLKHLKKEKLILKNYKATEDQHDIMQANADKYADGNLSEYIRYCVINYKPKKNELVKGKKR